MTPLTRSLLRAASEGDTSLIKSLLAQGADVNSSNAAGQTALMLGAAFGHENVVQFLLTVGARLDLQDELGLSALDWAKKSASISKLIEEAGKAKADRTGDLVAPPPRDFSQTLPLDEPLVRSTLPGLAGAILRDKKKVPLQEVPFEEVPAPTVPLPAVTVPDLSTLAVTAPIDIRETEPPTFEKRYETTPEIIPEPDSTVDSQQSDDTTLPRNQRITIEEAPLPSIKTPASHRIFDLGEPKPQQPPLSKVQVAVPETGKSRRPLVWVLLLLFFFLGVGVFVGYRLLHYLLQQPEPAVVQSPPASAVQPPSIPGRVGPVVGGDLVGTELQLTDAEVSDHNNSSKGKVTVNVRVSQKGIVVLAKAVDGDMNLRRAAEKAAKSSAFSPNKLAGKGAFITGTITYTFFPAVTGGLTTSNEASTPVAGGPLAGAELNLVEPRYSSTATRGVVSKITVVVRVNRQGRVVSWRPLAGDSRFRSAAISAARQSTFSPRKLPGSRDVVGTITYTFH
jgi:hypothetical protein